MDVCRGGSDLPVDVPWTSNGRPLGIHSSALRTSIGRPLDVFNGCPLDLTWIISRGFMEFRQTLHGLLMDVQWTAKNFFFF